MNKFKLSSINNLIENIEYNSKNELLTDKMGIRIHHDDNNHWYYDDFIKNKCFTLAGFHRDYAVNETEISTKPSSLNELKELLHEKYDIIAIMPFYLFEHGNVYLSTTDFNDKWDSACIGYVFMSKDDAKQLDITTEQEAKDWINNGIKQINKINNEPMYYIEIFEIEKCKCCSNISEKNSDGFSGYFIDDLKQVILDNLGNDSIDLNA